MKALLCPALLGILATASQANLVGLWKFDDSSNLGKATFGTDLTVVGTAPTWSADATYGTTTLNGVITTVAGTANRLLATHGIGANGGNTTRSAEYTLVYDIRRPTGNAWRTFYQTDLTNASDAEYFTRGGGGTLNSLGRGSSSTAINYTSFAMPEDQWLRITISVKLGTSFTTYMTNAAGTTSTFQHNILTSANAEYSLDPSKVLLFADNTASETNPLTIGQVAIFSHALTASEATALGIAGDPVPLPGNLPPAIVDQDVGVSPVAPATVATYSFSATDGENDNVQFQINWGDGQTDAWSPLQAVSSPYTPTHAYALPGTYTIQVRVRDSNGGVTGPTSIQTISVEGKSLIWTGALGSEWSTVTLNVPKNWVLSTNSTTTADFALGDDVIFEGTPSNTTAAINGSDVEPHSVVVDSSGNFTFTGDHGIAGPGELLKYGTGTLVLANPNPLQGDTVISSGIVRLDHPLALSNSVVTTFAAEENAGTLAFGDITGATLGGLEGDRGFSLTNPSSQGVALTLGKNGVTAIHSGSLSGSGSLVKVNSGAQALNAQGTFTGGTTLSGGSLRMGHPGALGSGAITHAGGSLVFSFGSGTVTNDMTLASTGHQTFVVRAPDNQAPAANTTVSLTGKLGGGTAGTTYRLADSGTTSNHNNVLVLDNAANDFSGTIELWRGFLAFTSDGALGNLENDLSINCGGGNGGLRFDADGITLGTTRTLTLVGQESFTVPTGTGTIAGPVAGTGSMVKRGNGELVFSAANTFTGAAAVNAGKLTVNGIIASSSNAVTVAATGTLGGSGTINRPVTAAGTIAPGSGTGILAASAATLTGTLAVEIDGAFHDQLAVSGDLNVTGATLNVSLLAGGFTQQSYVIATCSGTLTGTFAAVTPGYSVTYGSGQIVLQQQAGTGFDIWAASNGVTGFDTDSDGDGIPNGIEFIIGGNPAPGAGSNSSALLPKASYDKLTGELVFVFRRMPEAAYLAPVVEHTSSLSDAWSDGPAGSVVGAEDGADLVEVRLPSSLAAGGKLFARLKVEE